MYLDASNSRYVVGPRSRIVVQMMKAASIAVILILLSSLATFIPVTMKHTKLVNTHVKFTNILLYRVMLTDV